MFTLTSLKDSKFHKSLNFILFCIRNLCSKRVKKNFIYCATTVFIAKIVLVIQPLLLGIIIDAFGKASSSRHHLLGLISIFCLLGLFSATMLAIKNYFILLLREQISKDLTIELLKKLQQFSHAFFHNSNVAKLTQINNMGLDALHGFMVAFLSEIIPFLFELTLISIVVIAKFNLIISTPVFVVFILYSYISLRFSPKERASNSRMMDTKIQLSSQFYENVINFDSIKITNAEKQRLAILSKDAENYLSLAKSHGKLFFNKSLIQNIILYLGLLSILGMSIAGFLHKQISAGDFVMLNTYFFQITTPLINVLRSYEVFNKSITDIDPLMNLIQRNPDLETLKPRKKITEPSISVRFNNVNFSYSQDGLEKSLNDISFKIPSNHKLSLVGSTGSGKSTIAKLLMRFYDLNTGNITINETDIRHIPFSNLREIIGYVPQEIILFNDSILNNILLGRNEINMHFILDKMQESGVLDFVSKLENGFHTIVGDRGMKLSGGQKQCIGIARALIRNPKLLILDEYNSALDAHTEYRINQLLKPNKLECSILMIAHRLSSVVNSDEILVLKQGKIQQRGTHLSLSKTDGWYKSAWETFIQKEQKLADTIQ